MSNLPERVLIHEDAPREGFQSEPTFIPTETKIAFIEALANTGVREINCVSFVNPKRVPQMADSELVAAGLRRRDGVRYTGTWMNLQGFERALKSGLDLPGVLFLAASEQFGLRNNHQDRTAMLREQQQLRERYHEVGLPVSAVYVFTAFGCNYQGDIAPAVVERAVADLLDVVGADAAPVMYLADTVGWASPWSIERTVGTLRERWPQLAIGLHLHDTRGLGLANAAAGLRLGVAHFDASCGGLGGCPFAGNPAAAGNIATEELLLLCEEAGIATGVDLEAMIDCVALAESIVGHPLPSKVAKSGSLQSRRRGTVTTT